MPTTDPWIHRMAIGAIMLGYIGTITVLGVLVLILHDGDATRQTVDSLQQLSQWGLVALVFIVTGRPLFSLIGNMTGSNSTQATQTGGVQIVNPTPAVVTPQPSTIGE